MSGGVPLRYRPHHFLCSLGYEGKGYSPGFTANMTAIVMGRLRAEGGDATVIEVAGAADDLASGLDLAERSINSGAAQAALDVGLGVNAGHDLNRDNLAAFVRMLPSLQEVSIGHALISDALELGYGDTIRAYQACIDQGLAEWA